MDSDERPGIEPPETQIERWLAVFEEGRERTLELCDATTDETFNRSPSKGRWSVGQCLDHVRVALRIYLDPMEEKIEETKSAGRTGSEPYARGPWLGRLLIWSLRRPGGRYPAPGAFRPRKGELDRAAVRHELGAEIDRIATLARRAEGLPLGRLKMGWPVFGLIRISLAQAFELQALHVHRHLDQAKRAKRVVES